MGNKNTAPPDYTGAAEATAESNERTNTAQTYANRPTQNTPWGSSTWSPSTTIDPTTGQEVTTWEQNITLSPSEQASLDSQQAVQLGRSQLAESLIDRAGSELNTPVDWSSFSDYGAVPTGYDMSGAPTVNNTDFSTLDDLNSVDYSNMQGLDTAYNPDYAQTYYDRNASLLEPQMERDRQALDNQLRNQGLSPGTEAYDRAMDDLRTNQSETLSRLSQDAVAGGAELQQQEYDRQYSTRELQGNEAQSTFGNDAYIRSLLSGEQQQQFTNDAALRDMYSTEQQNQLNSDMQTANYQTALRQQQIAEMLQQRGLSISEMNALLYGQQVSTPSMPSFNSAGNSGGTDYLSAANMQGNYEAQQDSNQYSYLNSLLSNTGIQFG